jgi:hypothetical protein
MILPDFYASAPRLQVRDPLADFLGAAEGGVLDYGYEDAVKLAGHSCPTVASAYLLTWHALRALYPDALPERGGIAVALREPLEAGVAGVIASVVTLLTGAAGPGGFKGLGPRFGRRNLLQFAADLPLALRFTRLDNGLAVDAEADLSGIPADPAMAPLLGACLHGAATEADKRRFAALWQERVRHILVDHGLDPAVFRIRPAA